MNASKEEARNALEILEELKSANLGEPNKSPGWVGQALGEIEAFLLSAERKLPSEKSYEREKQRKRRVDPHPFVSTPNNGPCSSCGKKESNPIHKGDF